MLPTPSRQSRHATVVAYLALFVALGGTGYAALRLPGNSVGTKQLKRSAVTSAKVKNRSLLAQDFKAGQLRAGSKGDPGATGPPGSTGPQGPQGDTGPSTGDAGGDLTGAYPDPSIGPLAVTADKIADGAVTAGKLGPNAVSGAEVANESLSLSDLVGANAVGGISFTIGANACTTLSIMVSGAQVGQGALLSFTGAVAVPDSLLLGPLKVTAANMIQAKACNLSASTLNVSSLGVRVITFG